MVSMGPRCVGKAWEREKERDIRLSLVTLFFFSFPSFPLGASLISWNFVVARVVGELWRLEGALGGSML